MYSEVHTANIAQRCVSQVLREVLAVYQATAAEGFDAFFGAVPDRCIRHMTVLVPDGPGRFLYRHYGASIASFTGLDMLGKHTADFDSDIGRFFSEAYQRALDEGRPLFTLHRSSHAVNVHTWERLLLPLAGTDGPVIAAVVVPREFKSDFLQAVLASSPDAIVAVRAIRNDSGVAVDGTVAAANDRFAERAGLTVAEVEGRGLLGLLPQALRQPLWDRCAQVITTRMPQVFEAEVQEDNQAAWFRVSAVPLEDGVNLCFTEITALKTALLDAEAARDELRRQSMSDHLTGVLNRRGFDEQAAAAHGAPGGPPTSVIALDVDHFKAVNDRHGHATGDEVLRTVAALLREGIAPVRGIVGRTGGEEFMVALPGTTLSEAVAIAERLRERLSQTGFARDGGTFYVTASFGVQLALGGEALNSAFRGADDALYRAKRDGRNAVHFDARSGTAGTLWTPVLAGGAFGSESLPR